MDDKSDSNSSEEFMNSYLDKIKDKSVKKKKMKKMRDYLNQITFDSDNISSDEFELKHASENNDNLNMKLLRYKLN